MPVMGGLFASRAASSEGLGRLTRLEERSEIGGEVVDGEQRNRLRIPRHRTVKTVRRRSDGGKTPQSHHGQKEVMPR